MDSSGNKKKKIPRLVFYILIEKFWKRSRKKIWYQIAALQTLYIYSGEEKISPRTRDLAFILARSNKRKETPLQVSFPEPVFSQTLHNRETVKIRTERERNFRELSNRIQRIIQKLVSKSARELELHFHASVRTGPSYRPFPAEKTGEGGKKEREVSKSGRNEFNF